MGDKFSMSVSSAVDEVEDNRDDGEDEFFDAADEGVMEFDDEFEKY